MLNLLETKFNYYKNLQDEFSPIDKVGKKIKYLLLTHNFNYLLWRICRMFNFKIIKQIVIFSGDNIKVILNDKEIANLILYRILDKNEHGLTRFLIKNLKHDDVFYDIGANYGFYSCIAKNMIKSGQIFAFEPNPLIANCLQYQENQNLKVIKKGVSEKSGNAILHISSDGSGKSTTILSTLRKSPVSEISIDLITLDYFTKNNTHPTIIKLDVEGAELHVINGGEHFLKNYKGLLIMEIWSGERGEKYSSGAVEKLYKLGYSCYKIDVEGNLKQGKIIFDQVSNELENVVFKRT